MIKYNALPDKLYIQDPCAPWYVSEKPGICKNIPCVLKLASTDNDEVNSIVALYKLIGFNLKLFSFTTTEIEDFNKGLKSVDKLLIGIDKYHSLKIVLNAEDIKNYSKIGIYDIIDRDLYNVNREAINKRNIETREKRKKAATSNKLIKSISKTWISLDVTELRKLLNTQLKEAGQEELPKNAEFRLY